MATQEIGVPGAPVRISFEPPEPPASLPREIEVALALPVVSGTGRLSDQGDSEYAGVLSVKVPPLSANAMGVLRLAGPGRDLSFLVVMGAVFPPPGVQLGFGFSVTGIGGVVGVNRRIDRDALLRAVAEGWAADLLFPTDPVRAASTLIPALAGLFPPSPGSVVAGPMFQLSWGGRLVNAAVAVIHEASDRVRLSIVGKLTVTVPDPEVPLIALRATFLGEIDPGEPRVSFFASLTDSTMAGIPISGDLVLLTRGGADPTFVLSAGGFHPAFPVPRGVPRLRRVAMDLSPGPVLQLRCEAYVAVTTNTVQFGARLELEASVAGCGLRGHLALDVLVQWQPHLFFVADLSAGIAVRVAGRSLAGIHLDLSLSGPTPWRARGRGTIELFLFSVSFDFDEQWGSPPPPAGPPPDVGRELRAALGRSDAWVVQRTAGTAAGVHLTPAADRALGDGTLVDPHAALAARQRRVPLALTIQRFDRVPLPPQSWDISGGRLGARPVAVGQEIREPFAPAQFLALSDDEQLGRPAFERFRSGVNLAGGEVLMPEPRPADLDYETRIIPEEPTASPFVTDAPFVALAVEAILAAGGVSDPVWWQAPAEPVRVADEVPVAAAATWSLVEVPGAPVAGTATELHQILVELDRPGFAVVEQWEVRG